MPVLRAVNITKPKSPPVYPHYQANLAECPHWLLKILHPSLHSVLGFWRLTSVSVDSAMILSLYLSKEKQWLETGGQMVGKEGLFVP